MVHNNVFTDTYIIIKDVLCPKTIQEMFIVMFRHSFDLTDHMVGVVKPTHHGLASFSSD